MSPLAPNKLLTSITLLARAYVAARNIFANTFFGANIFLQAFINVFTLMCAYLFKAGFTSALVIQGCIDADGTGVITAIETCLTFIDVGAVSSISFGTRFTTVESETPS